MALQTINIDNRTYNQLLNELTKNIPVSEWTDHNPSDPGIMLLELLAWLGEMTLYRMNRVPDSHKQKFLKLLIDPPEIVIVEITLKLSLTTDRTDDFFIPASIRFATDFKDGKRYIFETFQETILSKPKAGEHQIKIMARNWKEMKDEELGVSYDTPNQTFPFKQGPILLDFVYASEDYNPNPAIQVGGKEWILKPFLLTKESRVSASNVAKHFMVDDFDNVIRFGDGVFGAIPPVGEKILCKRYQILEGPEALIKADEIKYILNPDKVTGLQAEETLSVKGNEDAEGGMYFLEKDELFTKGLENFRSTYRLITSEDFERVLLNDFNEFQRLSHSKPEILRAMAVVNRKPTSPSGLEEQPGHVTILVLPEFDEDIMKDEDTPLPHKQKLIDIDEPFRNKILKFLDKRRLITTKLNLISAKLKGTEIRIDVVINKERNFDEMKNTIRNNMYDFMSILTGYFDKKGWPLGKYVYKSQIYRLVEDIKGVDYVEELTLNPSTAKEDIELDEHELPVIQKLVINIERS